MSNEELACRAATPREELERQIMDSSVAKTEREWWCRGYIDSLRAKLVECERERDAALNELDEFQNRDSEKMYQRCSEVNKKLRARAERLEAALKEIAAATMKDRLFSMFTKQGFWHAHHVDIVWRFNGEDIRLEADWLKSIWYALRAALEDK